MMNLNSTKSLPCTCAYQILLFLSNWANASDKKRKTISVNNVNSEELKMKAIGSSQFDLSLKIDNSGGGK